VVRRRSASTAIAMPTRESFFDPGWLAAGEDNPDSRFLTREARRVATAQDTALARVYRTYAARARVVGLVLVAAQAASGLLGVRLVLASTLLCIGYAVQAITFWLLPRFAAERAAVPQARPAPAAVAGHHRRRPGGLRRLHMLEPGSSFNFAALLVLPVLMAGVLTSRLRRWPRRPASR
jgi:two-component system sensor histidine kinase PilS (NtrC family)